jgi:hypothetical protein
MFYARLNTIATLIFAATVSGCCTPGLETSIDPTVPADDGGAGTTGSGGSGGKPDAGPVVYPDPDPKLCEPFAQYDASPWHDAAGLNVPLGSELPAGGAIEVSLNPAVGQKIKEIRVRVIPRHHKSLSGENLPFFDFRRQVDATSNVLVARAWDPYAIVGATSNPSPFNAAGYSEMHDIVLTIFETVAPGTRYVVDVAGEWGAGEAQSIIVCGLIFTTAAE